MQSLARTSTKGTSYTASQIASILAGNAAQIDYRFMRLDRTGKLLEDFSRYVHRTPEPEVSHDSTASVMGTLKFDLRGDYQGTYAPFNPLSDLIEPYFMLATPDGGWVQWSLGVYTLAVPARTSHARFTRQNIVGADLSQLLVDAAFQTSFSLAAGTSISSALNQILGQYRAMGGVTPFVLDVNDPGTPIPSAMIWQPGSSLMTAINDLLATVTYMPIYCDRFTLRSRPIPDWAKLLPSYAWDTTTAAGITHFELGVEGDLSNAFNIIVVIVEHPQLPPSYVTYTNASSSSKVSTVNYHPKTRVIQDPTIASTVAAAARAKAEAQKSAWIYTLTTLDTLPWPVSQNLDCYKLTFVTPDEGTVSGPFLEVAWVHPMSPGKPTTHKLTQIVLV